MLGLYAKKELHITQLSIFQLTKTLGFLYHVTRLQLHKSLAYVKKERTVSFSTLELSNRQKDDVVIHEFTNNVVVN